MDLANIWSTVDPMLLRQVGLLGYYRLIVCLFVWAENC